jgi:16S rRNA (guanine527-N7)-methyltransferase
MNREDIPEKDDSTESESLFPADRIIEALRPLGINVPETHARQIAEYIRLLVVWNRKVSLTTVTDPNQILIRHFGESLFGAHAAGISSGSLLDVGSGAGFPALPIAIFSAEIHETLLEPNVKKAAFLSEVCRTLGLVDRVKILRSRLETYESEKSGFDFITSRAVHVTAPFLDRCSDLLRPGGKLVLWLGQEDAESLVTTPGWVWADPAKIPGSERRQVVCGTLTRDDVPRETN